VNTSVFSEKEEDLFITTGPFRFLLDRDREATAAPPPSILSGTSNPLKPTSLARSVSLNRTIPSTKINHRKLAPSKKNEKSRFPLLRFDCIKNMDVGITTRIMTTTTTSNSNVSLYPLVVLRGVRSIFFLCVIADDARAIEKKR
jgi:hypothetical protein